MRIVHCLRAPVGGLFRHVYDLSSAQAAAGHEVGVIVDATSADSLTEARLQRLETHLSLGLHRIAMARDIGLKDILAYRAALSVLDSLDVDVVHGHGAKGGAYARLCAASLRRRGRDTGCFYTPHGGSLHYDQSTLKGRVYMWLERRLLPMTTGIIFESDFSRQAYDRKVSHPECLVRVIPNGVLAQEFGEHAPNDDASDFLFVGELRELKGVDVLLRAVAGLKSQQDLRVTIVGDGPDADRFKELAKELGLAERVAFVGAMPARDAFPKGRVLVVPSRAESLPYIVLEAAAGQVPLIATSVGGIPEITKGTDVQLVPADDSEALKRQLAEAKFDPATFRARALRLQDEIRARYSVDVMASSVETFYKSAAAY